LLFFIMLFVPTVYQGIKACLLLLVLGMISVGALRRDHLALHPVVLLWTLFMATIGLAFMLLGLAHGAPGALRVGTVYVLWPLLYSILVAGVAHEQVLREVHRILIVATIAIGLYGISCILHAAGLLPAFLYIPLDQGQAVGFYQGFIEINLYAIASLLFLLPYVVAALLIWPTDSVVPVRRVWLWCALIVGGILVLLSGRRGLLLVVGLSPVVALIFRAFLPLAEKRRGRKIVLRFFVKAGFVLVALIGCLYFIYGFRVVAVAEMFATGFDFIGDVSASERSEQFTALLQEWSESVWFGFGHGASAAGSIRSSEMPWAYELSYIALLFQTGLLGFLAYTAGVVWIFWMGVRVIRLGNALSLYMVPILVGTACFLIANGTNPYLGKYDYLWVIFLPVAFINFWLLSGQQDVPAAAG
jgi:O-antigen ligase